MMDVNDYRQRLTHLESAQREWVDMWREIAVFLLPGKGLFPGESPDGVRRRTGRIIDFRPTKALRNLAALLQGGLTSPARPWFRLGLYDRDLAGWGPVRDWLDDVERRLYQAFARSNFYDSVHGAYTELAGFGTACLYMEDDWDRFLRCRVLTAGEYLADTDASGRVDTIFRRCRLTARQMIQSFGPDRVEPCVREAAERGEAVRRFDVIHAVHPRREREPGRMDASGKPFASFWFAADGPDRFLRVSGYEEFPFMTPRWDVTAGDVYGQSPAMDCLPSVKMLMDLSRELVKGVHKELDPPMSVPPSFKDRLNLLPGAVNYVDERGEGVRPLYQVSPNLQAGQMLKEDVLSSVREGFFNDLFVFLLNRPGVTATEVAERHEEKLLLLGPVIERQQSELLGPVLDRAFGLLYRGGLLPSPPPDIRGHALRFEYVSLLAQAQKLAGLRAVQSVLEFAGGASALNPQVLDKIDLDEAVDVYAGLVGAPPGIIRSDDRVDGLRRQRLAAAALASVRGGT